MVIDFIAWPILVAATRSPFNIVAESLAVFASVAIMAWAVLVYFPKRFNPACVFSYKLYRPETLVSTPTSPRTLAPTSCLKSWVRIPELLCFIVACVCAYLQAFSSSSSDSLYDVFSSDFASWVEIMTRDLVTIAICLDIKCVADDVRAFGMLLSQLEPRESNLRKVFSREHYGTLWDVSQHLSNAISSLLTFSLAATLTIAVFMVVDTLRNVDCSACSNDVMNDVFTFPLAMEVGVMVFRAASLASAGQRLSQVLATHAIMTVPGPIPEAEGFRQLAQSQFKVMRHEYIHLHLGGVRITWALIIALGSILASIAAAVVRLM